MAYQRILAKSLVLGLCCSVGVLTMIDKANAGGYDSPPESTPSTSPNEAFNSGFGESAAPSASSSNRSSTSNNSGAGALHAGNSAPDQPSGTSLEAWKNWSQPYFADNSFCRENGANLVCLSPNSASHMRW